MQKKAKWMLTRSWLPHFGKQFRAISVGNCLTAIYVDSYPNTAKTVMVGARALWKIHNFLLDFAAKLDINSSILSPLIIGA
jgi:hypothetical protein